MIYLPSLLVLVTGCFAAVPPPPPPTTLPPPTTSGCEVEGKMVAPGEDVFISPCQFCYCTYYNEMQCMHVDCEKTMCVDPHRMPGECCETCPNGFNCRYGDVIIKDGDVYQPDEYTWCSCPDYSNEFWFGNRVVEAICMMA